MHRAPVSSRAARTLLVLWSLVLLLPPVAADRVVRRDGPDIAGEVLSVDAETVLVRTAGGTMSVPRADVGSIVFDEADAPPPPLKVEIRNVRSDDFLDVLLDGEPLIQRAREGGRWIDVTDKLKDGNNPLQLRIHNERRVWGYQFVVRINDEPTTVSCGSPSTGRGCQCCGKTGHEIGIIEDLPLVWIHVDRALGRAEVLP